MLTTIFLIFVQFLYYGSVAFCGGSLLVLLYLEDLVHGAQWMTLTEFGNLVAIAEMTPGPIGINGATFLGNCKAGFWGGLAATLGLLIPGAMLMMIALSSLERWAKTPAVQGILYAIRAATLGMIATALLVYLEMSVLTGPIPWKELCTGVIPEGFTIRPSSTAIMIVAALLQLSGKFSIMAVILISTALGAVLCC